MKDIFADGRLVLVQGGMALKSSMGLAGAVASQTEMTDEVVAVGTVAITAQTSREVADTLFETRRIAGPNGVVWTNVMAADSRMKPHQEAALQTGEVDGAAQGAGASKDAPALCREYKVPFYPIICRPEQVAKYLRMFDVAGFIYENALCGGHIGDLQSFLFGGDTTLEQMVAAAGDKPVIAAGAIQPDQVGDVLRRGARGIQIATPYLLAAECELPDHVKKLYAKAGHDDVILVDSPAGMPGRALRNKLSGSFVLGEESTACFPPEAYGKKCVNCIKKCKCRDSGFTRSFCIRGALMAAKEGDLELGLFFTGDRIGEWNALTTVEAVTQLYLDEMYDFKYSR